MALPLLVPVFGLAWDILGAFTTGFVGKAVIIMALGPVLPYVVLAVMIKLTAYYIGMCRSMTLAVSIKRRRFAKFDRMFTQRYRIGGTDLFACRVSRAFKCQLNLTDK